MAAEVEARPVDDIDECGNIPGAYEFAEGDLGVFYICPCGCGAVGYLAFRQARGRPSWEWDGNRKAPTLTPSVHHLIGGVTHWHGYLTAGRWISC